MKHSIAIKIFSLSVGILIMMIIVAILNSIQVIHLGGEVSDIANKAIPLSSSAAQLNESGLRRRIAFERLFREYQMANPDSSEMKEAETNFEKFTLLVDDHVVQLRFYLANPPNNKEDRELYAKARELVSEIEATFNQQTDIA